MKLLRATVVIVALLGSAKPVAGQEPAPGDWSGVRRLAAGTKVVVTALSAASGPCEVLDSDDASLTVLNADGMTASGHGSKIRHWATTDPHALASVAQGGTITSGDLRIAPEGVFVSGRKVADLHQFLVRIRKVDVREVSRVNGRTRSRTAIGAVGGYLGFMGGFLGGAVVGMMIGEMAGADAENLGPMFFSGLAGGVAGAYFGHRAAAGPPPGATLIYLAPAAATP